MSIEERYIEMLDDCYPEVHLPGGGVLPMSKVLKRCDPIAYDILLSDFISFEEDEDE